MKNDISFVLQEVLNLYEHQSTMSPNLPLRGLFYFATLYRQMVAGSHDIYSSKRIELPLPKFVIFYNGTTEEPEQMTLYLHDSFPERYDAGEADLGYAIERAMDRAVDECIQEGILAELLRSEREEVRSMLLTEYDEQAHIESERKIAAEEAYAQGMEAGITQGMETGIDEGEALLGTLGELLLKESRVEDLRRVMKDKAYRDKLYEEYGLKRK